MNRLSASSRTSIGSAPLRTVNGPSSTSRNRGTKIPQGSGRSSFGTRSSFGSRSSSGTGSKFSHGASSRLSVVQKRSIGGMVTKPGASSRRSSGYGRGYGHETLKDPRPISSKPFKDKSIRKLIEFLSSYGYPHQLSPKMLISPITRDFLHIFEFLVRFVDSSVKLGGKHEEEVPAIFKRLRYPFSFSKSTMFAVGSPHTWPSLLAGLTWIREMIEVTMQIDADKELFQPTENFDFDGTNEMQFLFEYCEKAYRDFLAGVDAYDELDAELENKIKTCGEMADMEHLTVENTALKEELKHLQEQPDHLLASKQELSTLTLDHERIRDYDAGLDHHIKGKTDLYKQLETEEAELEAELEAFLQDNQKKQQIFETQEFSLEDIERINMDRHQLQRSIDTVEEDIKNLDQQIWNTEMSNAKFCSRMEGKCTEYTQAGIQLGIIPASGDYENGVNFSLTGKIYRHKEEATNFVNFIKPGLIQLRNQANHEVHQATEQNITESEAVDQMCDLVNEKLQAVSLLEANQRRLEDSIESAKEVHSVEQKRLQDAIFQLQDDLIELRKQTSLPVNEAQRQLDDEKAKSKIRVEERNKLERSFGHFLEQVVDLIVSHKSLIQEHTTKMRNQLETAHERNRENLIARGFLLSEHQSEG